ncbi:aspartyl protease AED3-like [Andrographis paniculata]|uniref:aspartyl protease AED3-like n=1 Tax=Andrographis paniculata TaxID=175694 RepID=UPI0021E8FA4E|nr:aspartyl protease AED3-like [Andrographis paniculata]
MAASLLLIPLSLSLLLQLAYGAPSCAAHDHTSTGSTLPLFHVNSPCSPFRPPSPLSWQDSVLQMQSADRSRLLYLSSLAVAGRSFVPIASGRAVTQNPTYIVRASLGTPAQTLLVAIDTSNDAAWIPCSGCLGCSATTFNSAKSATLKPVRCGAAQCSQVANPSCGGSTCGFNVTYGSSAVSASLVQDNITLASDTIRGYTFGCVNKVTGGNSFPAQGLLGLGRGPLSLISQSANLYDSTFSYCLPSYKSPNFSGTLRLGRKGQPLTIKTTRLLRNPRRSSFYYVDLVAIRVGARVVDIPATAFAFNPTTGAGTVFDSGTVFTTLTKKAYTAVRDELRRRMGKAAVSPLGGFDTCYSVPITVPTITFMFSGMNMTLPQDNFIIRSSSGNTSCLAMAAAPETGVNSGLNVIASFQQQNHRILIDIPNSKLGVAREQCS